ncbi:MAG: hypothetical protein ACRDSH_19775 [Pseudonocardiaceae bacterium]
MTSRGTRGIVAAAAGAAVALTALFGAEIGAYASTDPAPPKSHSCVEAIDAWHKVQVQATDPAGPGTVHDGTVITKGEQDSIDAAKAAADDPQGPGGVKDGQPVRTKEEKDRIRAAKDASVDPKGPGERPDGTDITVAEQVKIDKKKVAADDACKGTPGTAGTPGQEGQPGAPGSAGAPGQVIVEQVPVQSAPVVIDQAPAPQVQQQDGTGVPVTH